MAGLAGGKKCDIVMKLSFLTLRVRDWKGSRFMENRFTDGLQGNRVPDTRLAEDAKFEQFAMGDKVQLKAPVQNRGRQ